MSSYRPSRGYDDDYRRSDRRHEDERGEYKRRRYEQDDRYFHRDDRRYDDRGPPHPSHHSDRRYAERERERPTNPPSASVILLGLPPHVTDILLRTFLEDLGAAIETTNVIMDRATGESRRFGFAKFMSVEHARAFVEPNYPVVTWKERGGSSADGTKVKINYSASPGGWRDDQGGNARRMEDGKRQFGDGQADRVYMNDGTRDIGSSPGPVLLLRGLDTLNSESDVYKAFCDMPEPLGSEFKSKPGIRKILLAKDRASRTNLGFAFVSFADTELAKRVLAMTFDAQAYPTGFRVRNAAIALSFCHEGSFVPVYARSEFSILGEGGQQLVYWDDQAFVSHWVPENARAIVAQESQKRATPAPSKDEADIDAFFSSLEAEVPVMPKPPAPGQQVQNQVTLPAKTGPISIALSKEGKDDDKAKTKADTSERKKKEGDLIISRKVAPHIAKWNNKQQELRGNVAPAAEPRTAKDKAHPSKLPPPKQKSSDAAAMASESGSDEFEFADTTTMICLLCQRQFKGVEELRKHNNLSNLHKTNLSDESKVNEAKVRKSKMAAKASTSNESTYHDRAAARREAYNQPDRPERPDAKRKKAEPAESAPIAVQPANQGIDETNKGSKMLEKMGWSKGVGLGQAGTGIVDPVQAAQFQAGAGLGASKGVAVGTYDGSSKSYAQQIKDKARQRLADEK